MSITPNPIRIIKKATCPKLSPSAEGLLHHEVGYLASTKTFFIRVTANASGGFFSHEWIALDDIVAIAEKQSDQPFKATVFVQLYESTGANNHGFLAAACRAEGILGVPSDQPLMHKLGNVKSFKTAMNKLLKSKVSLHDDVAEQEAIKAARRAELVEKMQKAKARKQAASDKPAAKKATPKKAPAKPKSTAKKSPSKKSPRKTSPRKQ